MVNNFDAFEHKGYYVVAIHKFFWKNRTYYLENKFRVRLSNDKYWHSILEPYRRDVIKEYPEYSNSYLELNTDAEAHYRLVNLLKCMEAYYAALNFQAAYNASILTIYAVKKEYECLEKFNEAAFKAKHLCLMPVTRAFKYGVWSWYSDTYTEQERYEKYLKPEKNWLSYHDTIKDIIIHVNAAYYFAIAASMHNL